MRLLPLLALLLAGCFPPTAEVPPPVSAMELERLRPGGVPPLAEVAQGRELFTQRCGGCHNHPDVTGHQPAEWGRIVERMGRKADLSKAEAASVLSFIVVACDRALRSDAP